MQWHFGPFRLDRANARLWRAEHSVTLRPKTFEVLVYLVTHAGQLVTKEALLDAIWPETAVGEGVLKTSMNELRRTLGWTAADERKSQKVSEIIPGDRGKIGPGWLVRSL
jgi:DNA-binding winged helix-turn-helix (wHTH) protein